MVVAAAKTVTTVAAAKAKAATAIANAAPAVGIQILSRNRLTGAGTDVGRKGVTVGVNGTAATMDRDAVESVLLNVPKMGMVSVA